MTRISALVVALLIAALAVGPAGAQLPGLPDLPVDLPTDLPDLPVDVPTDLPTDLPIDLPTDLPTELPTDLPTELPTELDELLGDLDGLLDDVGSLVDPDGTVLDPAREIVDGLAGLIDDLLADIVLPNLLALQGQDAIDAAIAFSQATYDSSATAVVARDDVFADALTTGALQGIFDSPLLLTSSGDLDPRTAAELIRLGVRNLVILGADDAIDPLVAQKLEIAGLTVQRVGGPTRIETATMAAGATAPNATTAVLTRAYQSAGADDSQAYADLLAVSPWAAENDWPVLLTQSDVLTGSVADYLAGSAITEVIIIGGEGAISAATQAAVDALGIQTRRVSGPNRFATAVAVANERGYAHSGQVDRLILAEGTSSRSDVWAPGFAGAAHGSRHAAPILLTAGDGIPTETMQFILDGLADNVVDGGPAAVCASFVSPIACEAAGLLLLGDLTGALDGLGLELVDLPNIADILDLVEDLTGVALPDLPDLPVAGGLLDELVDGLETALDGLGETVTTTTDTVGEVVDGATTTVAETVTTATETVTTVTETVGGLGDVTGGNDEELIQDILGDTGGEEVLEVVDEVIVPLLPGL